MSASTLLRSHVGVGCSIDYDWSVDARHLLEIVRAANRRAPDVASWSRAVVEAARLDSNGGVAITTVHRGPEGISFSDVHASSPEMERVFEASASRVPQNFQRLFRECATVSGKTSSMVFGQVAYRTSRELHDSQGARDALGMMWHLDESRIVGLFFNLPRVTTLGRRAVHLRRLVAVHLATARRAYDHGKDEAWISPSGTILDASASTAEEREQLSLRVRAIEASRTSEPEEALERWKALVSGRWSLVETFEADGRRLFVARKNPPNLGPHLALTTTEETVLRLVALGNTQKLVAYSLGMSEGGVSMQLRSACLKLGLRDRSALLSLGELLRDGQAPELPVAS